MFPGLPESGKPWFFTENEYRIAKQRMDVEGVRPSGKINKTMLRRVFRSWKWYLAVGSYTMYVLPPFFLAVMLTISSLQFPNFELPIRPNAALAEIRSNNIRAVHH